MVSYGRWGKVGGRSYFFTHHNPKTHEVFCEERGGLGWIDADKVEWDTAEKVAARKKTKQKKGR